MKNLIATALFLFSVSPLVACTPLAVLIDGGLAHLGSDGGPADWDSGIDGDAGPDEDAGVDAGLPHRVLFVGNSFTSVNDVPGHYRALASAFMSGASVEAVTPGGYLWAQHLDDAQTDGTPLARWLRTGSRDERAFTAVVLQEQSQVGGFPIQNGKRIDSVVAATWLAAFAHANAASVVLYLTWGYERGDLTNRGLGYDTYEGMQNSLDDGYLGLAASLSELGRDVRVAPVGGGFRLVFEGAVVAGQDPLAEGSDFDALYEADGTHPSVRGAYLAACIIAGTITSADVRGFADEPTLGAQVSARLREVAALALADPRWHVPGVVRSESVFTDLAPPCNPWVGCFDDRSAFGSLVALNADATRALVRDQVYESTDAGWADVSRLPLLHNSTLSADGNLALAVSSTSAHLYHRSGATWTAETTLAVDGGPGCFLNNTPPPVPFVLTADGSRAVAGGTPCYYGSSSVSPRVFVRTMSGWLDEGQLPAKQVMALDALGVRALVSSDDGGVARVLSRTGSNWVEEASLVSRAPWFGRAMALSADGSRALGAGTATTLTMFGRSGLSWSEQAMIRSAFTEAVALSADGRRVAVGAPYDSPVVTGRSSGSVKVYELEDGGYRQQFLLVPRDPNQGDRFGASVAISHDGRTLLVGAPRRGAYTFRLPR